MKTSGIYKITSPSNRIYIGQSSNVKERFKAYKQLQKSKFLTKLYRSFLKYGIENHKFEIIEECLPELLNERERFWQDYYNVNSKKGKMSLEQKNSVIKNLEKARKNNDYRTEIDEIIRELLKAHPPKKLIEIKGSTEERINTITSQLI